MINGEVYQYKDNSYVVQGRVDLKNPETREWQQAILYTSANGKKCVREMEDFKNKFVFMGTIGESNENSRAELRDTDTDQRNGDSETHRESGESVL